MNANPRSPKSPRYLRTPDCISQIAAGTSQFSESARWAVVAGPRGAIAGQPRYNRRTHARRRDRGPLTLAILAGGRQEQPAAATQFGHAQRPAGGPGAEFTILIPGAGMANLLPTLARSRGARARRPGESGRSVLWDDPFHYACQWRSPEGSPRSAAPIVRVTDASSRQPMIRIANLVVRKGVLPVLVFRWEEVRSRLHVQRAASPGAL
jgi:hypothetical protein